MATRRGKRSSRPGPTQPRLTEMMPPAQGAQGAQGDRRIPSIFNGHENAYSLLRQCVAYSRYSQSIEEAVQQSEDPTEVVDQAASAAAIDAKEARVSALCLGLETASNEAAAFSYRRADDTIREALKSAVATINQGSQWDGRLTALEATWKPSPAAMSINDRVTHLEKRHSDLAADIDSTSKSQPNTEKALDTLQTSLSTLRVEKSDLQKELVALQASTTALCGEKVATQKDLEMSRTCTTTLRAKNSDLEGQLSQLSVHRMSLTALRAENSDLKNDVEALQAKTNALREEKTDLRKELETLRTSTTVLRAEKSNLENDLKTLRTNANTLHNEQSNLKHNFKTLQTDMAALRFEKTCVDSELIGLRTSTAALHSKNSELDSELGALRKTTAAEQQRLQTAAKTETDRLYLETCMLETELGQLQANNLTQQRSHRQQLDTAVGELEDLRLTVSELESENVELLGRIEDPQSFEDKRNDDVQCHRDEIEGLRHEISRREHDQKQMGELVRTLETDAFQKQELIDKFQTDVLQYQEKQQSSDTSDEQIRVSLEAQVSKLVQENSSIGTALEETKAQRASTLAEMADLWVMLKTIRLRESLLKEDNADLRATVISVKNELDDMDIKLRTQSAKQDKVMSQLEQELAVHQYTIVRLRAEFERAEEAHQHDLTLLSASIAELEDRVYGQGALVLRLKYDILYLSMGTAYAAVC